MLTKKNLKKILLLTGLIVSASHLSAQENKYAPMLKHTSEVVQKAQKTMLVLNKTEAGGKLAKAVLLQSYAVKLYKKNNMAGAACATASARKLAGTIICELRNISGDPFFELSAEEKSMANGCSNEAAQLIDAGKELKDLEKMSDKEYCTKPESLNKANIYL